MRVLLTEQDVLQHSYGIEPVDVPEAEVKEVQEPAKTEQSQAEAPVTQPSAGAEAQSSDDEKDESSTQSEGSEEDPPSQEVQSLDTLVSSLKDQYSARELQNKAQEMGIEVSGSKTEMATTLAKAILAQQS